MLMDPRSTDCEKKEKRENEMRNVIALGNAEVKATKEMRNVIALGNAEVKATKCIRKEKRENEFIVY